MTLVTPLAGRSSAFSLARSPATTPSRSQGRRSQRSCGTRSHMCTLTNTRVVKNTRACDRDVVTKELEERSDPTVPRLPPFCSDQPYGRLPTLDLISSSSRFNNYGTTNDTFAIEALVPFPLPPQAPLQQAAPQAGWDPPPRAGHGTLLAGLEPRVTPRNLGVCSKLLKGHK